MQFQTLPVSYLLKSEGWNTLATATLYCGVATTKPPGSYAHAHRPTLVACELILFTAVWASED